MASATRVGLRSFLAALPGRRGRGARLFGSSKVNFDEERRPGVTETEDALSSYADLYRHSFVEHAAKLGLDCECRVPYTLSFRTEPDKIIFQLARLD
jgi:hypothetical protein